MKTRNQSSSVFSLLVAFIQTDFILILAPMIPGVNDDMVSIATVYIFSEQFNKQGHYLLLIFTVIISHHG